MSQQSNDPPLVPVGGEIVLVGHRFQVIAHSIDKNGRPVEVPGKHLGPAPREKRNKHSGQRMAEAPTISTAIAPSLPAVPLKSPRLRKARRSRPGGSYHRYQPKPRPITIVNEPWGAGQWLALIIVLALIVAGIWFSNQGSEAKKWQSIESAAKAVEGR